MKPPSIVHHILWRPILILYLLQNISVAGYRYFDNYKRKLFAVWLFLLLAGGWLEALAFCPDAEARNRQVGELHGRIYERSRGRC